MVPGFDLADPADLELVARAREVAERAYAPYSQFRVGAAIRTEAGNLLAACNVENASYGLTICAERAAVFAAVAREGPGLRISAVAIHAAAGAAPPCGGCRQVLAEFGPDARVLFPEGGGWTATTVAALLPHPFELATREQNPD